MFPQDIMRTYLEMITTFYSLPLIFFKHASPKTKHEWILNEEYVHKVTHILYLSIWWL